MYELKLKPGAWFYFIFETLKDCFTRVPATHSPYHTYPTMFEDDAYIHSLIQYETFPLEPLFGLNHAIPQLPIMEDWPLLVVDLLSSVKEQPPPLEAIFELGSLENGVGRASHVDSIMWPVEKDGEILVCGMERMVIAEDVSEATTSSLGHFSDSLTLMSGRKMRRSGLEHAQARWGEEKEKIGSRSDGCVRSSPSSLPPDSPLRQHATHPSQNAVYISGSQKYTPNLPSLHNHLPVVTPTPSQSSTEPAPPKRRRKYPRFSIDQIRTLNAFMFARAIKRMPSEEEKEQLAGLTRMTVEQVTKWFQNHRFRIRRNGEAKEFERLKGDKPRRVWDYGSYKRFKEGSE